MIGEQSNFLTRATSPPAEIPTEADASLADNRPDLVDKFRTGASWLLRTWRQHEKVDWSPTLRENFATMLDRWDLASNAAQRLGYPYLSLRYAGTWRRAHPMPRRCSGDL